MHKNKIFVCYYIFRFSLNYDQDSNVDKPGMRIIVGHYVGGNSGGNLSQGNFHLFR